MKTYKRLCFLCENPAPPGSGAKYIFPIPTRYSPRPEDGCYACFECAPKIDAEQRAEGQLIKERKIV